MNQLNTLTGERKIMNMPKVGTVSQIKKGVQLAENPMNTGLRPIHYANKRPIQGGMVGGTVSHFTLHQLAAAALLICRQLGKYGSYVIPGQVLPWEHRTKYLNCSPSLTACRFPLISPLEITVPTFALRFWGVLGVAMRDFTSLLVRPAVWWILYVVTPVTSLFWFLAWYLVKPFSRYRAHQLAEFLQMRLVPFLLLEFIAWPLAEDSLRAKLAAERKGGAA